MNLQQAQQHFTQRVDEALQQRLEQWPPFAPRLLAAIRHGLLLGGKRVRPFLVYATGMALGATEQQLDRAAMAIECIHAYSLIHDDLPAMDDDQLRRGQPTCHVAFDEATAILAGDALQTLAFELLSEDEPTSDITAAQRLKMTGALARASGYLGMVGGQALDIAATNHAITVTELETLHRGKTGALVDCAVTLGALTADADSATLTTLHRYAGAVGLAFQVQDDILDVIGDTQTLGKSQGADESLNKSTYPALLGLEGAQQKAQVLLDEALQALASLPYNTELLTAFARYTIARDR